MFLREFEAVLVHLLAEKFELGRVRPGRIGVVKPELEDLEVECFWKEQVNRPVGDICAEVNAVGV